MPKKRKQAVLAKPTRGRPRKPTDTSTPAGQFAAGLRVLRERTGLSEDAMADECDVSGWTYRTWESGRYRPDIGSIVAILAALECSFEQILRAGRKGE